MFLSLAGCVSRENMVIPVEKIVLTNEDVGADYSIIVDRKNTLKSLKKVISDRIALRSLYLNGFIEVYERVFEKRGTDANHPRGIAYIGCTVSRYKTPGGALARWQLMPIPREWGNGRITEMGGRPFGERFTYFQSLIRVPEKNNIEEAYTLVFVYKNYKVSVTVQSSKGEIDSSALYPYAKIIEGRLKGGENRKI